MGLTRPQAIIRRMDAAGHVLRGAMRNLARMLAIVDYEHEEDMRMFGYSCDPAPRYRRRPSRTGPAPAASPASRPATDTSTPRWPTSIGGRTPSPTGTS